ncbi:hypothetical protein ON010_g2781 [Phytophthora cinnamomi]|nr:hypothetical protein ON010_g2781 [Phytophthora cinnamomi]
MLTPDRGTARCCRYPVCPPAHTHALPSNVDVDGHVHWPPTSDRPPEHVQTPLTALEPEGHTAQAPLTNPDVDPGQRHSALLPLPTPLTALEPEGHTAQAPLTNPDVDPGQRHSALLPLPCRRAVHQVGERCWYDQGRSGQRREHEVCRQHRAVEVGTDADSDRPGHSGGSSPQHDLHTGGPSDGGDCCRGADRTRTGQVRVLDGDLPRVRDGRERQRRQLRVLSAGQAQGYGQAQRVHVLLGAEHGLARGHELGRQPDGRAGDGVGVRDAVPKQAVDPGISRPVVRVQLVGGDGPQCERQQRQERSGPGHGAAGDVRSSKQSQESGRVQLESESERRAKREGIYCSCSGGDGYAGAKVT